MKDHLKSLCSMLPYYFVSAAIFFLILSIPGPKTSAASPDADLIRKIDDTNKQLDRIADALEIIAGTGSRAWKSPQ